ncbi:McrB family protein, partial [Maribacter dokdonensis]
KLKEEYFDKFTISESSLSKDQFILNVVTDLTWWQTFAIALYDVGTITVNQLLDNEIVKAKASLSNAKNIKPIAWSRMQAHALPDCPNVNVSDSNEPSLFYKEADSQWRIVKENVEALYPEGIELLNEIKNFQPNKDKSIKNYEFVTFHQSFSYEDFIEGIKPKLEEGASNLEYEINDGVFKKLCQRAQKDLDNNYCIFIDEINRGNVSSIFGELITLIEDDKRIGRPQELKVKLPYSKTEFGVPPNLYIIGTMNTADRSVEALDTALRRRFVFKEVMPDPSLLLTKTFNGFNLEQVLTAINERIEVLLDRDHTIGHSYFIKLESGNTEGLSSIFKNNIIPLLQEYFYNDYEKIALVLGLGFLREKVAKKNIFPKLKNIEEPENNNVYELVDSINNIEEAVTLLLDNSNE